MPSILSKARSLVADREIHLVPSSQWDEAVAELLEPERQRDRGDHVAHEEALRVGIRVVVDLGQPGSPGGDEAAHRRHEPDRVRAGNRQDVLATLEVVHVRAV
jgi:hypothetical protein